MGAFADRLRAAANKKATAQPPVAPMAPIQGQTANTAAQLQATTGKAGLARPAVTGQSNIMETVANVQAQGQQAAVQQQLQQTAEQVALQEKEMAVQQQNEENQQLLIEQENEAKADEMFNQTMAKLEYSDMELEDRKDQLEVEHAGRILRLRNGEYRMQLEDIANRERLDDAVRFQEAYVRESIGHNMYELMQGLDFAAIQAADQRQFNERNLIEDINTANDITIAAINDQAQANQIATVTGLANTAVQGYVGYKNEQRQDAIDARNNPQFKEMPAAGPIRED